MKNDFLIDPSVAYLNHGSFGACPRPVFEAYQSYQLELETEPVTFLQRRFPDLMASARSSLAGFLGCPGDQLTFVRNATYGMNQAARSLALKPGDRILTTSLEYGAIDRMWETISVETGAELVRIPVALPCVSHDEIISSFAERLDSSVRVVTFSHITSESAMVFPAKRLIRLARKAGAVSVVDGAHAPGQLSLELDDLGADFYTGNCHKWMLSPKGSAFLYTSPDWAEKVKPLVIGWGDFTQGKTSLVRESEWQGTTDISAFLAVRDAIGYRSNATWDKVQARCSGLLDEKFLEILAVSGFSSLYGAPGLRPPQMASFKLADGTDATKLHNALFDDYRVDVPVFTNADGTFLRISVQAYNSVDDLNRLIEALKVLV